MSGGTAPPIAGHWEPVELFNTGPWSVGIVWMDFGKARYCLLVRPDHCNATRAMHGGAMATFMDGQGAAVIRPAPDSGHTPTISLHIDYLAPPRAGDWLMAEVILVKRTRTMIFTQAIAFAGDRAMARSHAIYRNNRERNI